MNLPALRIISRSVWLEALRRREIYVVVLAACALIGLVLSIDFFGMDGLTKFYRETSLKLMSFATALAVVVLSARQLPREFERRTIYPLLARPISRTTYLAGKLLGVLLTAAFCFALCMAVYVAGSLYLGLELPWIHLAQYLYLQLVMLALLSSLCFLLSMLFNLDAAITLGVLLYVLGSTLTSMSINLYPALGSLGRAALKVLIWVIPQTTLFDFSEKTVHAAKWDPLPASTLLTLTLYGLAYTLLYFALSVWCFRRKRI